MKVKLSGFQTTEIKKCKIIGKSIRCLVVPGEDNPIPAFWTKCFSDGTIATLESEPRRINPDVLLGWCGDYNPEDHYFTYVIGVFIPLDAQTPEGMTAIEIPTSRFAVATIEGVEPDIFIMAHELTFQKIEEQGLEYDPQRGCEIEWYDDRFCESEDKRVIDLYVPIK